MKDLKTYLVEWVSAIERFTGRRPQEIFVDRPTYTLLLGDAAARGVNPRWLVIADVRVRCID